MRCYTGMSEGIQARTRLKVGSELAGNLGSSGRPIMIAHAARVERHGYGRQRCRGARACRCMTTEYTKANLVVLALSRSFLSQVVLAHPTDVGHEQHE